MMTKEQFVKRINLIQDFQKEQKVLGELIGKLTDGYSLVEFGNNLIFGIIDSLSEDMKINIEDDLIGWWLYEDVDKFLYEGEDCETEIDVRTAEQLYDYMVKYLNDKD